MNTIRAAAVLAVLLGARPAPAADAAAPDNCIDCHSKAAVPLDREHDYSAWKKSVHAKAGISCHECHGGDPSRTGADAHKGVLSSGDAKSSIYFTHVPETCGKCHDEEFKAFQKSAHFRELQRDGKGPNCVTCHGSMANQIMSPQQMEETCSLCHRKPLGARPALMAVNNASSAVERLGRLTKNSDDPKMKESYENLVRERKSLMSDWHKFQLKEALGKAQALTKKAIAAIHALSAPRADEKEKR